MGQVGTSEALLHELNPLADAGTSANYIYGSWPGFSYLEFLFFGKK